MCVCVCVCEKEIECVCETCCVSLSLFLDRAHSGNSRLFMTCVCVCEREMSVTGDTSRVNRVNQKMMIGLFCRISSLL